MLLYQILAFTIYWKKIININNNAYKNTYKINKLKASSPTCNEAFELPDESNSICDIQYYFDYIQGKHKEKINVNNNNPSIEIYISKIKK